MTVLIADHNQDVAMMIGYFVNRMHHHVHYAFSGLSTLKKAKEIIPHLIIVEEEMPDLSAQEICKQLRQEDVLRETRIVAQAGWFDDLPQTCLDRTCFDEVLHKPILKEKIERILRFFA